MVKKTGIIQEETLQSKELGAEMTILIYLPVNYSPFIHIMSSLHRMVMIISV